MSHLKTLFRNDVKDIYRSNLWEIIFKNITLNEDINNKFIILPHEEGLEIPILLSYGIKEEQIICVERDKTVYNNAKWRIKYPKVTGFNGTISCLSKITQPEWNYVAANFDFCGPLSNRFLKEMYSFFEYNKDNIDKNFIYGSTLAKGREFRYITRELNKNSDEIYPRIVTAFNMLKHELMNNSTLIYQNSYKNNVYIMLYFIVQLNHNIKTNIMSTRSNYTQEEDNLIKQKIRTCKSEGITKQKAFEQLSNDLGRTKASIEMRYYSYLKDDKKTSRITAKKPTKGEIYEPAKQKSSFKKKALSQLFESLPVNEKETFLLEQLSKL